MRSISGMKISAIMPVWNEEKNVRNVLDQIKEYPNFQEILVVNDGSTDRTEDIIHEYEKAYPHIYQVIHKENKGKAAAVKTGINRAAGEIIVMIDADLIGLKHSYINILLHNLSKNHYRMTILDRMGDRKSIIGWSNLTRLFGGERAFYKEDFNKMHIDTSNGYMLETQMNLYYVKNNLAVKTFYCPTLNRKTQMEKYGVTYGIKSYIKMFLNIYKTAGIKGIANMSIHIENSIGSYPNNSLNTIIQKIIRIKKHNNLNI